VTTAGPLAAIVAALDGAAIPNMLVGSFASSAHGAVRSTQDIDLVIDPTPEALAAFVAGLDPGKTYVSPSTAAALARRDQFNLVDLASGWKVDLIIRKDRPFSRSEFARRREAVVAGVRVWIATAEDTVLAKLEWAAMGGSERQLADAAAVLDARAGELDDDYLDRWAARLGVGDQLAAARRAASTD